MNADELRDLDRLLLADPERALGLCAGPNGWLDVFCGWVALWGRGQS